jgi:hypothetical protein
METFFRDEDLEDRVDQRRLADPGAAGNHQHIGMECRPQCLALAVGEHQPGPRRDPGHRPAGVDRRPGRSSARQRPEPPGDLPFGVVETGEEDAASVVEIIGNDGAVLKFEADSRLDQLRRHLEQLLREGNELVRWQAAMSVVHRLGERVGDAGTDANERGFLDAELGRDLVGGAEADTSNVAG